MQERALLILRYLKSFFYPEAKTSNLLKKRSSQDFIRFDLIRNNSFSGPKDALSLRKKNPFFRVKSILTQICKSAFLNKRNKEEYEKYRVNKVPFARVLF